MRFLVRLIILLQCLFRQLLGCSCCTNWWEHYGWNCCRSTDCHFTATTPAGGSEASPQSGVTDIDSLHSRFETLRLDLSLNHTVRNLFYRWCQLSQELRSLLTGINRCNCFECWKENYYIFQQPVFFNLLFNWLLLQKLHIWRQKKLVTWWFSLKKRVLLAKSSYQVAIYVLRKTCQDAGSRWLRRGFCGFCLRQLLE